MVKPKNPLVRHFSGIDVSVAESLPVMPARRDIDAEARAEGFKDWLDKWMHEKFLRWLESKGWSYDDDLKTAFIAGYDHRAEDD